MYDFACMMKEYNATALYSSVYSWFTMITVQDFTETMLKCMLYDKVCFNVWSSCFTLM